MLLHLGHIYTEETPVIPANSKRNYGNRVTGPWVFGIVIQKKSDIENNIASQESIQRKRKQFIRTFRDKAYMHKLVKKFECLSSRSVTLKHYYQ